MNIPLKIKELLSEKKLSMTEFSEKLGVSRNTVYNITDKDYHIDIELLKRVAKVLDIQITDFFDAEDLKIVAELEDQIHHLKRNTHIIESINRDIRRLLFYKWDHISLSKEDTTAWQDKFDNLLLAGIEAIMFIDKNPDKLSNYRALLWGYEWKEDLNQGENSTDKTNPPKS